MAGRRGEEGGEGLRVRGWGEEEWLGGVKGVMRGCSERE